MRFVSPCGLPTHEFHLGQCMKCPGRTCTVRTTDLVPEKVFSFARRYGLLRLSSRHILEFHENSLADFLYINPKFLKRIFLARWMYAHMRQILRQRSKHQR